MFEHLGHVPETTLRKNKGKTKAYIIFLLATFIFFTFSFSINRGPSSVAQEYVNPVAKIVADDSKRSVAIDNPRFPVFSFIIRTNVAGVELDQFKIKMGGIYDTDLLYGLKPYHQGVQLGSIAEVDEQGILYLDTEGYTLPAGDNLFSFILSTDQAAKVGDVLQFSFQDSASIVLSYKNHPFTPNGQWPVLGSLTSIVNRGSIKAQNTIYNTELKILDNAPRLVGGFALINDGEIADLYSLTFAYQELTEMELVDENFLLLNGKQVIAQGQLDVDTKQILFDLAKPFVINNKNNTNFQLHTLSLPEGKFEFYLQDIVAKGFVSGQELPLQKQVRLSQVEAVDYYPEFSVGELQTKLSNGWNELYNFNIKAEGSEDIKLHKLTWSLDSDGTDVEAIELWVNDKQYMADLVVSEEGLTIKTDWEDPLAISRLGTNLKLLVKVSKSKPGASLRAYLLTDTVELAEEELDANIMWSLGEQFYSGYRLPYLPLEPSVLSY
jgi:hypothetical protein